MTHKLLFLSLIFTFVASSNTHAQWVEANQAPFYSAGYYGVGCIGQCGSDLFAATNYEGVMKSTDSGMDWTQVNNGLPSKLNYYCLRTNGSTLYTGTDSGIYLTTNSGMNWLPDTAGMGQTAIYDLAIKGDTMVATTWNNSWYIGAIYRSTNGGATWETDTAGIKAANDFYYFLDIAFSGPYLVVAAGGISGGTTPTGVFLSTEYGASWVHDTTTLPSGSTFTCLQAIGSILVGGIAYDSNFNFHGALVRSTDHGATWSEIVDSIDGSRIGSPEAFAVSDSILFTSIGGQIYFSRDSGVTWQNTGPGPEGARLNTIAAIGPYLFGGASSGQGWGGTYRREISQIFGTSGMHVSELFSASLTNYPNPFTQSTTINFTTTESGVAGVSIVDILGTEVARIFSGQLSAGEHSFLWGNPTGLPDGLYECIMQMNGSIERVPMVLAR
jgi:photosystem II stability/assembly factor-like uncharacterized protein